MTQKNSIQRGRLLLLRGTVILLILCVGMSGSGIAMATNFNNASSSGKICPEGIIDVRLPEAPTGMVSTREVTLDTDCQPIYGPVQFVPLAQVPQPTKRDYATGHFETIKSGQGQAIPLGPLVNCQGSFHAALRLYDVIGLLLNEVYSDVCWSWNGTNVTGYSASGGYNYHPEYTPAGPGWTPINPYNVQSNGCVGCSYVTIHQHTEFSYKGVFDPSGTLYYNTLDDYENLFGSGTKSCTFTFRYRNWYTGWHNWTQCS